MDKYNIEGVKTFEFTKIIGLDNISFGHDIIIDDFVLLYATAPMKIGSYVHIACFTSITGGAEFTMDEDWGFGNPTLPEEFRNVSRKPVHIEKFAIVGANSVVCPGVTIGEGATVAANSVVTRDLEPWSVYAGNRKISRRDKDAVMETYQRFLEREGR
jgi:galactoside O-acetyltransferase